MTRVFITVDVECREERLQDRKLLPAAGYDLRVWGKFTNQHEQLGIPLLMRELEAANLRATFFVDPMSSDSFGMEALAAVCRTVRSRSHDVQLHLHPRQSHSFWVTKQQQAVPDQMAGYPFEQQVELLRRGVDLLRQCDVPRSDLVAFRAGHFAANNDTWRALREVGLTVDSSYNASHLGKGCALQWPRVETGLFRTDQGLWELPITNFVEGSGHFRHLQIAAVSVAELESVLLQASALGVPEVTILTHSFELFHLDSVEQRLGRLNTVNFRRFHKLCRFLHDHADRFQVDTVAELAHRPDAERRRLPVLLSTGKRHLAQRWLEQSYKRMEMKVPSWRFPARQPEPSLANVAGQERLLGENIICFAKDWSEDPTSNNHIMRLLARDNRVLWINSIGMRTPKVSDKRDLRKIVQKLASVGDGARQVHPNLWVYTPLVLPMTRSAAAQMLNRQILKLAIKALRHQLAMDRFQLWTFLPTSAPYINDLGAYLKIYYCTDEFSKLYEDPENIKALETSLLRSVDLVFATARSLLESKRLINPEIQFAPHGVDFQHFSSALRDDLAIPDEVATMRPIIGFFGLLRDWIDLELLAYAAERHPEWSIVLIGPVHTDVSRLARYPNVHLLGRRPFASLPAYCKAFSVATIPFAITELTIHVNPIKVYEYLAAGVPVVTTPLPEAARLQGVSVATNREEFVAACERAIAADSPEARRQRSQTMMKESWDARVANIGAQVLRVKAKLGR